jgi:two-component system, sensor histidine kinase RegB
MANAQLHAELGESRLRLQTAVRLRWFGLVGQLITVGFVHLVLGFRFPVGICLAFVALSAWLNVFLRIRYSARFRLGAQFATLLLAYDILQLSALLYLTGGIENPFSFLIVAPVTVSAATLPARNTIVLGVIAAAAAVFLVNYHFPLPWSAGVDFSLPMLYKAGALASIGAGMSFLALYTWRLSKEARQMSAALAATEHVLAREQQLHALDGLAAAAAHELGTPLATITLVAKELAREVRAGSPIAEDVALLHSQAVRCREILQKLTRMPSERDPLYARLSVTQLLEEAAEPHKVHKAQITISARSEAGVEGPATCEPVGERRPGVIHGLGNIIENAVDFCRSQVAITARWSATSVTVIVSDDGPGFQSEVMESLGEPYITTRASDDSGKSSDSEVAGLGLGFFIAKTLLERSGASLALENRPAPRKGAVVRITWPREAFEAVGEGPQASPPQLITASRLAAVSE